MHRSNNNGQGLAVFLKIPRWLRVQFRPRRSERLNALAALAEVSLVKHDPFEDGTPAVTVHRLVQAAARARSEANGLAQEAVGRLIARLAATYPADGYSNPQSWPLCAKLTPHLLARRVPDDASVSELLVRAGIYFHGRAAYFQALPLLRDALAIREKALGPEHPDTALSLNNVARLLRDQGDFAGARPLYERALAIREKALGPKHPDTANSLANLANLLRDQGDFAAARPLCERALSIRENARGPGHPDTATSLNSLALLFRTRATFQRRGRSASARWRYAKRRSASSIPIAPARARAGKARRPPFRPCHANARRSRLGRGHQYACGPFPSRSQLLSPSAMSGLPKPSMSR